MGLSFPKVMLGGLWFQMEGKTFAGTLPRFQEPEQGQCKPSRVNTWDSATVGAFRGRQKPDTG